MPATILPLQCSRHAASLPLDELHELDHKLTLLTFSLERAAHPDFVDASREQLGALAHHALAIQREYQSLARRILAFSGHPARGHELTMGNPVLERLQRAALFGDPLDEGNNEE